MKAVADASAILALLQNETGADFVAARLRGGFLSAVNLTEIAERISRFDELTAELTRTLRRLEVIVHPFDEEQALIAAQLKPLTRGFNISLADRCCLAAAKALKLPILTADRIWADLDLGIDIRLIR